MVRVKMSYLTSTVSGAVADLLRSWQDKYSRGSYVSGRDVLKAILPTLVTIRVDKSEYAEALQKAFFPGDWEQEALEELLDILEQIIEWLQSPMAETVVCDMGEI